MISFLSLLDFGESVVVAMRGTSRLALHIFLASGLKSPSDEGVCMCMAVRKVEQLERKTGRHSRSCSPTKGAFPRTLSKCRLQFTQRALQDGARQESCCCGSGFEGSRLQSLSTFVARPIACSLSQSIDAQGAKMHPAQSSVDRIFPDSGGSKRESSMTRMLTFQDSYAGRLAESKWAGRHCALRAFPSCRSAKATGDTVKRHAHHHFV